MTDEPEDGGEAEAIAHFAMADSHGRNTADYVARGRRFQSLSKDDLRTAFVTAFKDAAKDVSRLPLATELGYEFELRRSEPPYDLVKDEVAVIGEAVASLVEGLSEEQKAEIETEMMDDYLDAQSRAS